MDVDGVDHLQDCSCQASGFLVQPKKTIGGYPPKVEKPLLPFRTNRRMIDTTAIGGYPPWGVAGLARWGGSTPHRHPRGVIHFE
jgi:hypothetical protein